MVVHVDTDYGPVGIGQSGARFILADNDREYLIKGPTLNQELPYGAVDEIIAAGLAREIGLPILDYQVVEWNGAYFFGTARLTPDSFIAGMTEGLFLRSTNRDQVYELVAFDVWLRNFDRHDENLIGRERRGPGGSRDLVWYVNDHDRCLIWPGETPQDLATSVHQFHRDFVRIPFIRQAITDPRRLRRAVDRVGAVNDLIVGAVVGAVPDQLLSAADRPLVEQFVRQRRDALLAVFRASRGFFGNLEGGAL
jgi:hypothetical protein